MSENDFGIQGPLLAMAYAVRQHRVTCIVSEIMTLVFDDLVLTLGLEV